MVYTDDIQCIWMKTRPASASSASLLGLLEREYRNRPTQPRRLRRFATVLHVSTSLKSCPHIMRLDVSQSDGWRNVKKGSSCLSIATNIQLRRGTAWR